MRFLKMLLQMPMGRKPAVETLTQNQLWDELNELDAVALRTDRPARLTTREQARRSQIQAQLRLASPGRR